MIPTSVTFCISVLWPPSPILPVAPPPRPKIERALNYLGEVLAVDKSSITIKGQEEGWPREKIIRTFQAGEALLRGEQDPREKSSGDYRLVDVKVGDVVFVVLHTRGVEDICETVRIRRRPGGIVPPAPFENPETRDPYHVRMNAYQALEEKGIPLPPMYSNLEHVGKAEMLERLREMARKERLGLIAPPPRPKP